MVSGTFLDEAETDVLAYMTFPAAHRAKLHSTNPIERLNGDAMTIIEELATDANAAISISVSAR